jgi:hypothetical protein
MANNTLQLDLESLPTKYIALCEFTAVMMGDNTTAKDVDKQVEMFLTLTNFEATETNDPDEEVHLNG